MILKYIIILLYFSAIEVLCDYKSSLTFVIDHTASMGDDIDAVKISANDIFDTVLNSNASQIEDFVLVTFDDPETQVMAISKATERDEFKQALLAIRTLDPNMDCAEYSMSGILVGIQESRPGSTIYVFTDASAKDHDKYEEVKHNALKKQIQVVFVLTGMCYTGKSGPDYKAYEKLAKDTQGEIFHLEKQQISEIIIYVMENIKGRRTPLATKAFPSGTHTLNFSIDKYTTDVTVSVSGYKPTLKITDPDGNEVKTELIVNLDKISIVKMIDPKPGDYVVEVYSGSDSNVQVSARTKILFQQGFSTFDPSSFKETITMPFPDVKSHIAILLNDVDLDLDAVQILDMDDKLIEEVTLFSDNQKQNFYTTELQDLPKTMFKLAIVGFDPDSDKKIRRIGPPVAPQPRPKQEDIVNKAPNVTIMGPAKQKIKWKLPLQLKCKVNGYPQPNIIWVNKNTGKEIPDTSVLRVELPYDYISILNVAEVVDDTSYECRANNHIGSDSANVAIEITAKPYFTILKKPEDMAIKYHNEGELNCKVDAYPPATITWYKDRRLLLTNANIKFSDNNTVVKIKKMGSSVAGSYLCEVRNIYHRYLLTAQVTLTGVERPVIDDHVQTMTVQSGSDVTIACNVLKGIPKPSIIWYFKDAFSGKEMALHKWNDQQSITLGNINKKNAGLYSCIADNEFGSDYHEVSVTIEYPVEIKYDEKEKEIRVSEGTSIEIPCTVEGNPNPKVAWYKDDVPLSSGPNIFIYKDNTIKMTVSVSDSGNYKCVAKNKFATASKVVKVVVYGPTTIDIPEKTKIEVLKGSSLNLPCQAKGQPTPTTEWVLYSFNPKVPPKSMQKSVGASVFDLKNIQLEDTGYYTCIASNLARTTNITFEIHVIASPEIENTYTDSVFEAVEGDLSLMIQCKASGNPPSVIKWLNSKDWFATSSIVKDGTLVLNNVSKNDSGIYMCLAESRLGFARRLYQVKVNKAPQVGTPTSTVVVDEGSTALVRCDVPVSKTDQLRWYKNGMLIRSGELTINNAKSSDSGLYTCRVSGPTGSKSGTILVKVGRKPSFTTDEMENIDVDDGSSHYLICKATGDPQPQFRWWHNGELINTTDDFLYLETDAVVPNGQYVCEAKNELGSVIRHFNLISSDCIIDLKSYTSKLQPLLLSPFVQWPENIDNGNVHIPKQSYVYLFCSNKFKTFSNRHNLAFCEGGTKFIIQGQTYDYSDIECTEEIKHIVETVGRTCLNDNTELLKVSFKIKSETVEVYSVCFDNLNSKPLYTTLRMTNSTADFDYPESEWANEDLFDLDFEEAYKCNRQTSTRSDGCCFSKRMLVSPKDLFPSVVVQKSAYSYLNVVPQWSTCNTNYNNWNDVEHRVRSLSKTTFSDLLITTGVAEDQNLFIGDKHNNRQAVPTFLWKVVQEEGTKSSLVIIQVNKPDLSPQEAATEVRCRDICNTTKWMRGSNWYDTRRGFIYCCSLKDFEDSFNYKGVFLPHYKVLSDATALPDHSLV